ncbi:MAG: hypothetical protein ACXAC7_14830 [Candidatus Hodarchaeales archaeon]
MSKKISSKKEEDIKDTRDLEALRDGIGDLVEDMQLMEKYNAPDIEIARKIKMGNFPSYDSYLEAELKIIFNWILFEK